MRAVNGSIVEVFEWKSSEASNQAHKNVAVQALWAEFSEVCDYIIQTVRGIGYVLRK